MDYHLCKHCDHFVEPNEQDRESYSDTQDRESYSIAAYDHLEDGEQEFDHDAEPGDAHTLEEWYGIRPDLFKPYPDGKIGPNSSYHSQRGKANA